MILSKISYCIVFLLVLTLSLPALARESDTVASEGVAVIRGNARDKARTAAIQDAKQRAVEQAISTLLDPQTRIENHQLISDKILSKTGGYIKQYDIKGEIVDSGLLRVRINAEIALGRLIKDLAAIGLHPSRSQKLRSVNITVIGLDKKQFVTFKDVLLKQMNSITGVHEQSYIGTTAKIVVNSKISAQIVSDELTAKDFGNFSVEVVSSTANSLKLKVTKKP